ncbi:hypothetical protein TIFTF001_003777 [Ficus carica]|uniref:Uncharacterized protein n=1 Tax=Ficus carica TaxID=3494 RepID=A0AA87Z976_FICCA|nr:hypothetical protein TIFTF001_003777 [Ficus carica]
MSGSGWSVVTGGRRRSRAWYHVRGANCSEQPHHLRVQSNPDYDINRHTSADTGGGHRVSLTRRRRPALGAKAGIRIGPVAVRTVRGHEHGHSTVVVREVLPGMVLRAPKVISSWSAKGRSSTLEVVVVQHSFRGSSTRVNIGPTRWWSSSIVPGEVLPGSTRIVPGKFYPGQHRTNLMVVVRHSSRGSSTRVNKHSSRGSSTRVNKDSSRGSSTRVNIGPTRWWSSGIVPGEVLPGSTSIVPEEVQHRTNSMVVVWHCSWGSSTWVNKHSSWGSSTSVRDTRLPTLLQ